MNQQQSAYPPNSLFLSSRSIIRHLSISSFTSSTHLYLPSLYDFTAQGWKIVFSQVFQNTDAVPAWMEITLIPSPFSAIPAFSHPSDLLLTLEAWGKYTSGIKKREEIVLSLILIQQMLRTETEIWKPYLGGKVKLSTKHFKKWRPWKCFVRVTIIFKVQIFKVSSWHVSQKAQFLPSLSSTSSVSFSFKF